MRGCMRGNLKGERREKGVETRNSLERVDITGIVDGDQRRDVVRNGEGRM